MEATIKDSEVYKEIAYGRNDIEIWDDDYIEDGWAYWNIVSSNEGVVRKLAYLRIKENQLQKRTYDDKGDDLWVLVK
ncbi:MAG: hypothetical protein P8179_21580 [Candidatus Thiodiazotropha sp.]|jgi:hypothetical protein